MNKIFSQKDLDTQQIHHVFSGMPIINSIFKWLANLFKMTSEDQKNAGVYLGGEGRD